MAFVPISRIITMAMAGVVCFGLIVPLALSRRDYALERIVIAVYVVYVVVNVAVWLWARKRA